MASMKPTDRPLRERVQPRSVPQQERSRARFQALLDVAEEVIAESGLDGLQMREVARRANLPIASVYHYFPSSTALIRTLLEKHLQTLSATLESRLAAMAPREGSELDLNQASLLIDDLAMIFFTTPSIPTMWLGMQGNPDLRALDVEDTFTNAEMVQSYFTAVFPYLSPSQAKSIALVLNEMVMGTLVLAVDTPPDIRPTLLATLKTLLTSVLSDLQHKRLSFLP
jgi:AcrR family transcriptional regulator